MKYTIFLADYFIEDHIGGAELTSEALIHSTPNPDKVGKIKCSELNRDIIDQHRDAHWVVLNFTQLSQDLKFHLIKNVEYSIVEYDYKFCNYRSLELCRMQTSKECDCVDHRENKINLAFYGYAQKIWFMSDIQKNIFLEKVRTIKKEKTETLKGFNNCVKYATTNNLKHEIITNLPYHELLIKLSTSRGLIFLPDGADTCPRLVMEAQMLGCEVITNENVQHKDEQWAKSALSCREHMKTRVSTFWNFYG